MAIKTEICVTYDREVTNLGGASDCSRDNTSTTWDITDIKVGKGQDSLYLDGPVVAGSRIWLIWAVWSDGDSFGHDYDSRIEFITVHRDEDVARKNAELLCAVDNYSHRWGHKVNLSLDDGTILPYLVPWLGQFERLSYIECQPFVITEEAKPSRYYPKH